MLRPLCLALSLCLAVAADATEPRADFLLHCAGCHRVDATGLPPEIPSLVGTLGTLLQTEEGRQYVVRVPGSSQAPLTDDELAELINWLAMEYSEDTLPDDFQPLDATEVAAARANVLVNPKALREQLWPDLDAY